MPVARLLLLAPLTFLLAAAPRDRINLNGTWPFRTDPNGEGEQSRWYTSDVAFTASINVPGVWQAQGVGEPKGILRNHYVGKAWYRRQISVPAAWAGKSVLLHVGGVVRRATIYCNDQKISEHDGFSAPFSVDLTSAIRPGALNSIAFMVENPGEDVLDSPDKQRSTQITGMLTYVGNWGGIYGNVHLEAVNPSSVERVAVITSIAPLKAVFRLRIRSTAQAQSQPATVAVQVGAARATVSVNLERGSATEVEVPLPLPGAKLWTPSDPQLHTARIRLTTPSGEMDQLTQRFGLREVTTQRDTLLLNGKPLYLRGFGDDNIEVLTGAPSASRQVHLDRLKLARSYGFNAVRFHSMTPPQAYFEAADEAGIFVMAELPVAYTMHLLPHKEKLRAELEDILHAYRNHPSFLSLALGNEFNLSWLKTDAERKDFLDTVADFYKFAKSIDPQRLILSNDGYVMHPTDMLSLFRNAPGDVPAVRHEFGSYYCSLPDINLINQFTGVVQPVWLAQKQEWVERNGLINRYGAYLDNSRKLQHLGRKFEIEKARRMQSFTGYHYWLIVDFPGGTGEGDSWEEGWFDYFWKPKGVTAEQGRELNSPVLMMIDSGVENRTFWTDNPPHPPVTLSNYGEDEIRNQTISWSLNSASSTVASGLLRNVNAPLGRVSPVGAIDIGPLKLATAQKLQLVLRLKAGAQEYVNRWDFWAFPRHQLLTATPITVNSTVRWANVQRLYAFIRTSEPNANPGLLIASRLDETTLRYLRSGGRVWLLGDRDLFGRSGDAQFFPASGGAQGSVLQRHPALNAFPHDGFFDLQFFNLVEGAWHLPVDNWPKGFTPIAGSIHTTASFLSKQKALSQTAYIVEAKVGQGALLITTLALRNHLDDAYPEAVTLFDSLLRYVTGPEFHPQSELTEDLLARLAAR